MKSKPTGQDLISVGSRKLSTSGIKNAAKEAKILLSFSLGFDSSNTEMLLSPVIDPVQIRNFYTVLEERIKHKPIAKIIGKKMFYKDEFVVNEHVLDPRPETEILVTTALESDFSSVLDLGTGSGCILISLLRENTRAYGLGIDLSDGALEIAQKNGQVLGVSDRVIFMKSNWFEKVKSKFDIIVSNPPYISSLEFAGLSDDVVKYDPQIALLGGDDGLESFRIIISEAYKFLNSGGRFIVEVGFSQGKRVKELFFEAGYSNVKLIKDLSQKDRVVVGSLST